MTREQLVSAASKEYIAPGDTPSPQEHKHDAAAQRLTQRCGSRCARSTHVQAINKREQHCYIADVGKCRGIEQHLGVFDAAECSDEHKVDEHKWITEAAGAHVGYSMLLHYRIAALGHHCTDKVAAQIFQLRTATDSADNMLPPSPTEALASTDTMRMRNVRADILVTAFQGMCNA